MIITKLMGGLGNQMFQYAAGRALSDTYNTSLKLDISYYEKEDIFKRSFILDKFNIIGNIATVDDKQKFINKNYLYKLAEKLKPSFKRKIIIEKPFEYYRDFEKIGDDAYLDGYWQSEKYFKHIESIIRNEFTLKNISKAVKEIIFDIEKNNTVSIHTRRADYVTLKNVNERYGICSIEYYQAAINNISEQINSPNYYIFSDDVAWVKENLKLKGPMTVVSEDGFNDYEEIIIMSKCKYNIIANSSFSWWGAWLNENSNKIVIAPKKWLSTDEFDVSYMLPNNWIKL